MHRRDLGVLVDSDAALRLTRRHFLSRSSLGLGSAALASLMAEARADGPIAARLASGRFAGARHRIAIDPASGGVLKAFHVPPKAKRVIYLFMSGGPSQLDLFDYKPLLNKMNGQDLPESVRMGQRLTGMSANQATLPMAGSIFKFARHGKSGAWVSELLPHTAGVVDELCIINSLYTEAINHDPAITFFQTGSTIAGRPSMGSWLSYGLGSTNQNLPTFCVLISQKRPDQPLYSRLWGNGFLPSVHQGVRVPRRGPTRCSTSRTRPASRPPAAARCSTGSASCTRSSTTRSLDPAIQARIAQYEMAYRMQTSVPEVTRLSDEPDHVFELYGPDSRKPGTFAANCLLARRLAERDVRFIQLYHPGWDHHGGLPGGIRQQCRETDQACAALIQDLKQRGHARRHAGALGRRVRPHQLQPGEADGHRLRPRPSPPLLHRLGGRRRDQAGHHLRRDRPVRLQRRHRRRPRPRLPRHDPPPARHRPRTVDLQAPGALLPPHRRLRQGGQGDHRLKRGKRGMPGIVDPVHGGGEPSRSPPWALSRSLLVCVAGLLVVPAQLRASTFVKARVPRLVRSAISVAPGLYMLGGLSPSAAYVIETSDGLILVDSGLDKDASPLKAEMAKLGLDWKRVRAILLTHAHGDHTGGAEALRLATGAKVYAGEGDVPVLRPAGRARRFSALSTCRTRKPTRPPSMSLSRGVRRSRSATSASRSIAAPGHTPGSMCYLMDRRQSPRTLRGRRDHDVARRRPAAHRAGQTARHVLGVSVAALSGRRQGLPRLTSPAARDAGSRPACCRATRGADVTPQSPCLSQERWQSLLDAGHPRPGNASSRGTRPTARIFWMGSPSSFCRTCITWAIFEVRPSTGSSRRRSFSWWMHPAALACSIS